MKYFSKCILGSLIMLGMGCSTTYYSATDVNIGFSTVALTNENVEFGDVITGELSLKGRLSLREAKNAVNAKALEGTDYDFIVSPRYEYVQRYLGFMNANPQSIKVTGRGARYVSKK